MKRTCLIWAVSVLSAAAFAPKSHSQGQAANKSGIEVLTRGPVHDAFAQPISVQPAPGPIVPKEPPPPIPENPPEQKPDVPNVEWVPGYWAWDAQQGQFIWISGVYRVPPQDRTYVPGYWASAADGWRWVPGYWSAGKLQDTPYTPEPPASLDEGPITQAPNADSMYVPGAWLWQGDRFVWQPGYWSAAQEGRVWMPPNYLWTPRGYAYVDGYWDYPLQNRGVMFAPVYFNQPLWNNSNWAYQPSYVLSPGNFLDSAFTNGPGFYFGNYYGPGYGRAGFNPWYAGRGRYDPTFAYNGWKNPGWLAGVQGTYAARGAGRLAGPPISFAQQGGVNFVTPLGQAGGLSLVNTSAAQRSLQRTGIQQTRQLAVTRQQFEASRGNQPSALRMTAGSSPGGMRISNGPVTPRPTGPTAAGPKITNAAPAMQPRTFAPAVGPRVVAPAAAPVHRQSAPAVGPAARGAGPAPVRPASASHAHAAGGHHR